ncbi:hypothetical protein IMCC3317_42770 [Kordia antarctica]|uniref:Transglutaminase-like domain-containing protein n=1 Tax=Kordia antarctica TaxID=1218801 RepID=A0A7L4ZQW2_9FLAO|nr:hypothetical protein [Kordia antarctica]QHI38877.1 hypothetical protein IMCC3317_42770 [Kordia antarctica]
MLNFPLSLNSPLSKLLQNKQITNFKSAIAYINQLPYGRTSDRSNYSLIISENKGTCSTKHAFLKQLAIENNQNAVELYIGIYQMNETNTKGVGNVLNNYNLDYIPEAHTYLKINGNLLDITRTTENNTSFEDSLLTEEQILPHQIANYKVNWHQNFIKKWILDEKISFSFDAIWKIREECIAAISD